jgi:hypothetical protein
VGLYAVHLERWFNHFEPKQLLIWVSNAVLGSYLAAPALCQMNVLSTKGPQRNLSACHAHTVCVGDLPVSATGSPGAHTAHHSVTVPSYTRCDLVPPTR